MKLNQAIVFAILMENGEGIIGKVPSYVEEKLKSTSQMSQPECLLDPNNLAKYEKWQEKWGKLKEDK